MVEKKYSYNARWSLLFAAGGLFAVNAVVMAHQAATNDRGVIIESFFRLGPEGATAFYWCVTIFSVLFVLASIAMAVRRIVCPRVLVTDPTGLWLPHGVFQRKLVRVDFSEVLSLSELKVKGQISLRLTTHQRTYSIAESLLPSRRDYDDIKSAIASAVPRGVPAAT